MSFYLSVILSVRTEHFILIVVRHIMNSFNEIKEIADREISDQNNLQTNTTELHVDTKDIKDIMAGAQREAIFLENVRDIQLTDKIKELKRKVRELQLSNIALQAKFDLANEYYLKALDQGIPKNDIIRSISPVLPPTPVSEQAIRVTLDPPRPEVLQEVLRPNPHLDSQVLTRNQLKEVLMWALADETDPEPVLRLLEERTHSGTPATPATKLISTIASLWYGDNNYIGPGKTGADAPTITEAVATVPILTEDDARARAHDIGVSVSDEKHVDEILSPAAQVAQIFQPLFLTRDRPRFTSRREVQTKLVRGGIEQNPGPPKIDSSVPVKEAVLMLRSLYCKDISSAQGEYYRLYNRYQQSFVHTYRHISQLYYNKYPDMTDVIYGDDLLAVIRMRLLLSGDIEENPGPWGEKVPTYAEFKDSEGQTEMEKFVNDPTSATAFITVQPGTNYVNLQSYVTQKPTVLVRSMLDERTYKGIFNSNWVQLAGWQQEVTSPAFNSASRRLYRCTMQNKVVKGVIAAGTLGTGVAGSLVSFSDYLAAQRTSTNAVAGGEIQQIYARAANLDYGDYVNLAKLMCYSSVISDVVFSATQMDTRVPDYMNRVSDISGATAAILYPGTDNSDASAAPLNITIQAVMVTQASYAEMLLGSASWPLDWNPNEFNDVAVIPFDDATSPRALALITICHLEFPFFCTTNALKGSAVFNGNQNSTVFFNCNLDPLFMRGSLVDGPKYKVLYVRSGNATHDVEVGTTPIHNWNPAAPNNVDIAQALIDYVNINLIPNNVTGMFDAFNYFLRFADINDWKAAMMMAGTLMQRKSPYQPLQLYTNSVVPLPVMGDDNPNWSNQISVRNIASTGGRDVEFAAALDFEPMYTHFGVYDYQNVQPNVLDTPRPRGITCCYFQVNTHVTRYAIFIGLLVKKNLAGTEFSKMFKGNVTNVLYSIFSVSDIMMDVVGEWMVANSVITGLLHDLRQRVVDMTVDVKTKIADLVYNWQTKFAGFAFLRNTLQAPAVPNASVDNYYVHDAMMRSPLLLTYRHMRSTLMDLDYMPQVIILDANVVKEAFYPNSQGTTNTGAAASATVGGLTVVSAVGGVMYDKDGNTPKMFKEVFAQAHTQFMGNPNLVSSICDVYTQTEQSNTIEIPAVALMYMCDWLRYASPDVDTLFYRDTTTTGNGVILPSYPFLLDVFQGRRMVVSARSANMLVSGHSCMSLDGKGDARYTLAMPTSAALSKAFATTKSPF